MFCVYCTGYDVIQQDKEKGRSNVLRLSHPGCETHFLSTDSVSETQAWYNRIESTCNSTNTTTTTLSNSADQGADSTIPGAYRVGAHNLVDHDLYILCNEPDNEWINYTGLLTNLSH